MLSDVVGSDTVQGLVALHRDGFRAVGIGRMVGAFTQKIKAVHRTIKCLMSSSRLTDIAQVDGKLFDEGVARGISLPCCR